MSLSKRNRRGLIWLLLIALIVAYTPRILTFVFAADAPVISHHELLEIHDEFIEAEHQEQDERKRGRANRFNIPQERFDPNTYFIEDWVKLGLSEKQAEVVVNFAKRGLRSNDDLKRIFVFPNELFDLVKDSTVYPEQEIELREEVQRVIQLVDLNIGTPEEFESLPGIGPFYAKLIIEQREKLGGFYDKNQLLELYKFDKERLAKIDSLIFIGNTLLRKIDLNHADINALKAHPYIDYSIANSIVKMRAQQPFERIEDIRRSKLIDENLFLKLKPYLIVK